MTTTTRLEKFARIAFYFRHKAAVMKICERASAECRLEERIKQIEEEWTEQVIYIHSNDVTEIKFCFSIHVQGFAVRLVQSKGLCDTVR